MLFSENGDHYKFRGKNDTIQIINKQLIIVSLRLQAWISTCTGYERQTHYNI